MKRSPRPARTPSNFSESINQQLNLYALAAGAAGVGMLASAPPAEARIVYTPANIPIVEDGGLVELDLNHDGVNDFQFSNSYTTSGVRRPQTSNNDLSGIPFLGVLRVAPAQNSNRVWAVNSKSVLCAAALPKGTRVGPRSPFQPGHSSLVMAHERGFSTLTNTTYGPWVKVRRAFLGLKFVISGKAHFGWARIRMGRNGNEFVATITGYAYETVPNKSIVTGKTKAPDGIGADQPVSLRRRRTQTAALGLLAMGSPGISLWRREEQPATAQ
jgi:hypothetical protein